VKISCGWRTVRPTWADGRAYDLLCGRSVPGARTVRRLFDNLCQRHCCLCLVSRMDCGRSAPWERKVRWLISMLYQRLFVSGVVELLTADGPPLGRGRSAWAVTAISDMHLMHSVFVAYNGGQSGFCIADGPRSRRKECNG
jgi:hypothetical protein